MHSSSNGNDGSVHYTYHRTSAYDPNLCSTAARLSPSPSHLHIDHDTQYQQSHSHPHLHHHLNQNGQLISDNYGNIILIPCNHEEIQSQHNGNIRETNTIYTTDFGAYQILQDSNQTTYNNYDSRSFIEDDVNHHHITHNNHHHHQHSNHHLLSDSNTVVKNPIEMHSNNSLHHYNQTINSHENNIQYTTTSISTLPVNNIVSDNIPVQDIDNHSQLTLQRHYQNFYINDEIDEMDETAAAAAAAAGIVEMVQAVRNEMNLNNHHNHHLGHGHHQYDTSEHHNTNNNTGVNENDDDNADVEFRLSQNSTSGLISTFSEANFTTLESSLIGQQELIDNYDSVVTTTTMTAAPVATVKTNDHHRHHQHQQHNHYQTSSSMETVDNSTETETNFVLSEKDHHRFLLRRTISPLLAAVNDIAQRDAELQSYLNQSRSTANETNDNDDDIDVFQINQTETETKFHDGNHDDNNESNEYLDINEVNNGIKTKETRSKKRKSKIERTTYLKIKNKENQDESCLLISDKPVESRARASLPTNYLYFVKNKNHNDNAFIVHAKREIPNRTKFGPFEGEIRLINESSVDIIQIQSNKMYPIPLLGDDKILVVSNENTSNWMRFVRIANSYDEQNLVLIEDNDEKLYFRCCRTINPKEELRVGYSEEYAIKYNLEIFKPNDNNNEEENMKFNSNVIDNPWSCFECEQKFHTSDELKNHLNIHDSIENESVKSNILKESRKRKRKVNKKIQNKSSTIKRLSAVQRNSSRCFYCYKVFMTSISLKRHIASHVNEIRSKKINEKQTELICNLTIDKMKCCYRKFSSEEKLRKHRLVHLKNETKPYKCSQCNQHCSTQTALASHIRSHSVNKRFRCAYCTESFKQIAELKNHVICHSVNGIYPCNLCGKKYSEYSLARKHIRVFHPGITYSCTICDKQFVHMSTLRRHMSCHSDKKDFLCSKCGQQFKRKDKLKSHIETVHSENRKPRKHKRKLNINENNKNANNSTRSQHIKLTPKKTNPVKLSIENPVNDYECYAYKCHQCKFGFKRRGMLVNHMVKRHPEIQIDSVPELNLPIVKVQSLYFCPYCTKVYKNNSKRKIHILKSHPGQELPPSARNNPKELLNARTIGSIETDPQRCQWCYKQYATRNRLLLHYRKEHSKNVEMTLKSTEMTNIEELPSSSSAQIEFDGNNYSDQLDYDEQHEFQNGEQFMEQFYHNSLPPHSPENKLLKLSSAALELSSIEDRKFFDFLNERTQDTLTSANNSPMKMNRQTTTSDNNMKDTIIIPTFNNDDNATDDIVVNIHKNINFKIEDNNETSSSSSSTSVNNELNRLPELFDETIACI